MEDTDEKLFTALKRAATCLPAGRRRGKAPRKDLFVKVPLWWIEQAAHATRSPQAFVCIWLLHLAWRARSTTFPLPNGRLGKGGSDRRTKARALAALEGAGLNTVERRHGKTPIVTLVVL